MNLPSVCERGNKYKVMSVDGTLYLLEADRNRHEERKFLIEN